MEIRIWGQQVGAVALDETTGFYVFEYSDDWIKQGVELSPFTMPNRAGTFTYRNLDPLTFYRLPPMLADSLPDRFGNALVNSNLVRMGLHVNQITALDRLAFMGERGMGALTFHPPTTDIDSPSTAILLADLVTAAKASLSGTISSDALDQDALMQLIQVGSSAGGARPKAVLAYNRETKQYRSGQLSAPHGFEHWILKLDGVSKDKVTGDGEIADGVDYCRIEYAYSLMARAAGIDMTDSELLLEGPRAHFLTKRFDREPNGERIHMQSLCAIKELDFNLPGAHAYEQYFQTIRELNLGSDQLAEGFRRMVFNVAACNRDDHTKNFSFLHKEGGDWQLAPAYDITHAHNSTSKWTQNHQMSINGKLDKISLIDLRTVGDRQLIPDYENVIREVLETVARWTDFAETAGLSAETSIGIHSDLIANRPN